MKSLCILSVLLCGATLLGMKPHSDNDKLVTASEIVGTMQVEGTKQGMILGRPDTGAGMNLISFKMGSEAPLDPKSNIKGARTQHLIVVTKEIDNASPKLFLAYNSNEVLKNVVIQLTKKKPDGKPMVIRTVKLTDVVILKIRREGPDLNPQGSANNVTHMEEISYSYRLIQVLNAEGSTTATDDWNANDK